MWGDNMLRKPPKLSEEATKRFKKETKIVETIRDESVKKFQDFRNELDSILDDYEDMETDFKFLHRIYKTYNMMKDLLEEMQEAGDLDNYNTKEIFNRIEEHEKEIIYSL